MWTCFLSGWGINKSPSRHPDIGRLNNTGFVSLTALPATLTSVLIHFYMSSLIHLFYNRVIHKSKPQSIVSKDWFEVIKIFNIHTTLTLTTIASVDKTSLLLVKKISLNVYVSWINSDNHKRAYLLCLRVHFCQLELLWSVRLITFYLSNEMSCSSFFKQEVLVPCRLQLPWSHEAKTSAWTADSMDSTIDCIKEEEDSTQVWTQDGGITSLWQHSHDTSKKY